jgi:ribosome-binding ATPase YchF (GTP1/OBG family)
LDKLNTKKPLEYWTKEDISTFVRIFLQERFPTVIALNKIDLPDADKNIDKICRKYDQVKYIL